MSTQPVLALSVAHFVETLHFDNSEGSCHWPAVDKNDANITDIPGARTRWWFQVVVFESARGTSTNCH